MAEDWGPLGQDRGYAEMTAVSALLGGGLSRPDHDQDDPFAELEWGKLRDPSEWGDLLDAVIDACGDR